MGDMENIREQKKELELLILSKVQDLEAWGVRVYKIDLTEVDCYSDKVTKVKTACNITLQI